MSLKHQIKELTGRDVYVPEYEDIRKSDRVNSAGRACYVERNQWIIDDSDFVIFRIDRKTKSAVSGTLIAYGYAQKNNKHTILL